MVPGDPIMSLGVNDQIMSGGVKKFLYGNFDISHKYTKIPHEVLRPRNYEVNPTTLDFFLNMSSNVVCILA